MDDIFLKISRHGFPEETHWTTHGSKTLAPRWLRIPSAVQYSSLLSIEVLRIAFCRKKSSGHIAHRFAFQAKYYASRPDALSLGGMSEALLGKREMDSTARRTVSSSK